MKKAVTIGIAVAVAGAGLAGADIARAHGDIQCKVPRKERKPQIELQRILKQAGWVVKKMQVYNGCYEVYGFDPAGDSVEAFFDPRTLERMKVD